MVRVPAFCLLTVLSAVIAVIGVIVPIAPDPTALGAGSREDERRLAAVIAVALDVDSLLGLADELWRELDVDGAPGRGDQHQAITAS